MSNAFKIPDQAYDSLLDLIEMGPKKLERLTKALTDRELTLDVSALAESLGATIKFSADRVEQVIYAVLIPLNSLRTDFQMTPDDFLRLLADVIARQKPKWYEAHGEDWKQVAPKVKPLLAPGGYFALLSKTLQLWVNRPSVASEFKILTELRPVYDDELSSTKAMVLTSTLVVDYEEGGESKRLHLSVDQSSLRALQEQLDRAEKKVQLLEEKTGQFGVPLLVAGSE